MAEVIAETERLILRTWREEDRAVYLATCNTPSVTRHLDGPATEEDVDAALARIASNQAERGFSFWAIERKADGTFLGYCGLRICDDLQRPVNGDVEIGWRLREDAWGQGYAYEAARAALAAGTRRPVPRWASYWRRRSPARTHRRPGTW